MLVVVAIVLWQQWLPRASYDEQFKSQILIPLAITGLVGAAVASILAYNSSQKRLFEAKLEIDRRNALQKDEKAAAESGAALTLPKLWALTQRRIDLYHDIATAQAKQSFRNAVIASFLGFGVLIVVGISASLTQTVSASIAAGAIGLSGAALSAFLGATFLRSQSESSAQLQQFFSQPVDFARLLGAERLIDTLPPEGRSTAVDTVITAMMSASGSSPSTVDSAQQKTVR